MSPVFLTYKGYRMFVWSKEENRQHIHVKKDENECKYWLDPHIELAENNGFKKYELNEIIKIIEKYEPEFKEQWRKHFG